MKFIKKIAWSYKHIGQEMLEREFCRWCKY